jgi:hypothetical protein
MYLSLPTIPNIQPNIHLKSKDVENLLLASIALEEIALAHILNAEGEKIQKSLEGHPTIDDMLKVNQSVRSVMKAAIMKEMLLLFKLQEIIEYELDHCDEE